MHVRKNTCSKLAFRLSRNSLEAVNVKARDTAMCEQYGWSSSETMIVAWRQKCHQHMRLNSTSPKLVFCQGETLTSEAATIKRTMRHNTKSRWRLTRR
eukprot:10290814-Heterocapsa_arctica.AAC.1